MPKEKVAVCVYYKNQVLTGANSCWLADEKKYKVLSDSETIVYDIPADNRAEFIVAKFKRVDDYFSEVCRRVSTKKLRIQYGTIDMKVKGDTLTFKAPFLRRRDQPQIGIIKGDVEKNETNEEAAVRELKEECGLVVDPKQLVFQHQSDYGKGKFRTKHTVYTLEMDAAQKKELETIIAERESKHEGELFDLKFRDVNSEEYNDVTMGALFPK